MTTMRCRMQEKRLRSCAPESWAEPAEQRTDRRPITVSEKIRAPSLQPHHTSRPRPSIPSPIVNSLPRRSTMSIAASRAVLRRPAFAVRRSGVRNASTETAKEKAAQLQSKASEGLSKVTSSAGAALSKFGAATENALNAVGKVGGRTGRLVGTVQGQ